MNRDDRSRRIAIALAMIVSLGLTVRVWYASEALHPGRFVDEKYSLENIGTILTEGFLGPANTYYPYPLFNYPPAALVAASDALYRWTEIEPFRTTTRRGFSSTTYFLVRIVQCLYGALALVLTYLIGRRIFSPVVGLIGALALAFLPWHIHASGYFKPDAQTVAMVLLAFYWSLNAIQRPSVGNHLLAGVGVALAMSSKLTGGLIAIPLVIGGLVSGWRDGRRLALLALSGITSLGAYILLNPLWRLYPTWLMGLEREYSWHAAAEGMTRSQIPGRVLGLITAGTSVGPFLGTLGVVAFGVLAIRAARTAWRGSGDAVERLMLVSFPIVFTAAYALRTAHFKDNNFLPIFPFFCLFASWALIGIYRWAEMRLPWLQTMTARTAGLLIVCWLLAQPGLQYTYRTTTPSTLDQAIAFLGRKLRPPTGRVIYAEKISVEVPPWEGPRRFGRRMSRIEAVERLSEVAEAQLRLADGLVVRRDHLQGDLADHYKQLIHDAPRKGFKVFRPRFFVRRGPAVVALRSGWRSDGRPVSVAFRSCRPRARCLFADLPSDAITTEWGSLVVSLGFVRGTPLDDISSIEVGTDEIPLLMTWRSRRNAIFVTPKFLLPQDGARVRFVVTRKGFQRQESGIDLFRWTD